LLLNLCSLPFEGSGLEEKPWVFKEVNIVCTVLVVILTCICFYELRRRRIVNVL
jgi:Na+/melibiose symporter-like transporter